jgi:Tfp pilus assembly protein PilZ
MALPEEQVIREPVIVRLIRLILDMQEDEQYHLLRQLEDRFYNGESVADRQDTRKPYKTTIEFYSREKKYKGFSKDISSSGMFIITSELFSVGQVVSLKISFANNDRFIKVPAQIVRMTEDGIGVEFMKKTEA